MKKTVIITALAATLLLGACTQEELTSSSAPVENRIQRVEDIAHAMQENGMTEVTKLFGDLRTTTVVTKDDPKNIAGMGSEDWMYSSKDNVTVIVCNMMNTPITVFEGRTISQKEIDGIKKMMKDMM